MDENAEMDVVEEKEQGLRHIVRIADVENPQYVSLHQGFLGMVKNLVANDLRSIPSITYESLVNYYASIVDGVCKQKLTGVHPDLIQTKLQIGFVDDELKGFQSFHMLGNRLPHVQTLNWAYIYSEDPRLTHYFAREITKYQKKWKAKFVSCTITNKKLDRVMNRLMKKASPVGTYYIGRGIRHEYINTD